MPGRGLDRIAIEYIRERDNLGYLLPHRTL